MIICDVLSSSMSSTELRMMAEGKFASLPRNLHMGRQCTLAASMDLLSSGMKEVPSTSYQGISIHGTLPRKKKGGAAVHSRTWECGSLPHPTRCRLPASPLIHNIIEENQPFQTWREDYTVHRYHQHATTSYPSIHTYHIFLTYSDPKRSQNKVQTSGKLEKYPVFSCERHLLILLAWIGSLGHYLALIHRTQAFTERFE